MMDKSLVDYFMKETNKKFEKVDHRFDDVETKLDEHARVINDKVDEMMKFKWQIIGLATGGGGVLSIFITIAIETLFKR